MGELDISGNSLQLDCSVDSGICVEGATKDLKKKLQEFKRILFILERDKEAMRLMRERLSRIVERKIVKKKKDAQICNVCFTPIDTDDFKTCIACSSCAKNVCRDEKCSEWVPKDGEWRCQLCTSRRDSYGKASTWVEEQYTVKRATPAFAYPMRARSEIYIPLCDPNDSAFLCNFESVSEAPSPINANQKQHIREYIEEVLAEMIGGPLDKTSVAQLSTDDNCQRVGNGNELQGISNARLRLLIESIIAETVRQPPFVSSGLGITKTATDTIDHNDVETLPLNGNHCNGNGGQYFESKKYQDLLATAVLNKIVNTHGNGRLSESSPDLTISSLDNNHNALNTSKADESISSSSSIEPRSESSLTDPIHSINKDDDLSHMDSYGNFYADSANDNIEADRESVLSDFIASHMVPLPHISAEPASEDEDEEEDFISVASSGRDATWEDNWLFKKKKSSKTSASVGMLVPAPKEDIRALIGDKPTDEVSDLSEVGSDDDSSLEMVSASLEPLNDRLVNQHLIGGKNTKIVLDELVDQSSLISTSSLPENVPPYTETKNEFVVSNDGLNEAEPLKISVNSSNVAISNEAINSNVTKNISAKSDKVGKEALTTEDEAVVSPPNDFTDDEKMRNLLAKFNEEQDSKTDSGDENSSLSPRSSISCALSAVIGRSDLEAYEGITDFCVEDEEAPAAEIDETESSSRRPSVIEILAAIALGPMLAVSASDDRHILSELEVSSLMELNDLAMAELNSKSAEERSSRLGVICEESFDSVAADESHHEIIGNVKEPDLLSSPDMVMRAIRELVGNDAKETLEDDTEKNFSNEDESIGSVVIAEIHNEELLNDQPRSEENPSESVETIAEISSLKEDEHAKEECKESEVSNFKIPETASEMNTGSISSTEDSVVLAKEEADEPKDSPNTDSNSSAVEAISEDKGKRSAESEEIDVKTGTLSTLPEEAIVSDANQVDTEENVRPNTESYPSAVDVYLEAIIETNNSSGDFVGSVVDDLSNSMSNESLRTIGNSSENLDQLEIGSIGGDENVSSLAELAADNLQLFKDCEQSVEEKPKSRRGSQVNEFILPPPRQFSDEKVSDDDASNEMILDTDTHTIEDNANDGGVKAVKDEETKTHNQTEQEAQEPLTPSTEKLELASSAQTEKLEEPPDKQSQLATDIEEKKENEINEIEQDPTMPNSVTSEEAVNDEHSVNEQKEKVTEAVNEVNENEAKTTETVNTSEPAETKLVEEEPDLPPLNTPCSQNMAVEIVAETETYESNTEAAPDLGCCNSNANVAVEETTETKSPAIISNEELANKEINIEEDLTKCSAPAEIDEQIAPTDNTEAKVDEELKTELAIAESPAEPQPKQESTSKEPSDDIKESESGAQQPEQISEVEIQKIVEVDQASKPQDLENIPAEDTPSMNEEAPETETVTTNQPDESVADLGDKNLKNETDAEESAVNESKEVLKIQIITTPDQQTDLHETEESQTADIASVQQFFETSAITAESVVDAHQDNTTIQISQSETKNSDMRKGSGEKISVSQYIYELAAKEQAQLESKALDTEPLESGLQPETLPAAVEELPQIIEAVTISDETSEVVVEEYKIILETQETLVEAAATEVESDQQTTEDNAAATEVEAEPASEPEQNTVKEPTVPIEEGVAQSELQDKPGLETTEEPTKLEIVTEVEPSESADKPSEIIVGDEQAASSDTTASVEIEETPKEEETEETKELNPAESLTVQPANEADSPKTLTKEENEANSVEVADKDVMPIASDNEVAPIEMQPASTSEAQTTQTLQSDNTMEQVETDCETLSKNINKDVASSEEVIAGSADMNVDQSSSSADETLVLPENLSKEDEKTTLVETVLETNMVDKISDTTASQEHINTTEIDGTSKNSEELSETEGLSSETPIGDNQKAVETHDLVKSLDTDLEVSVADVTKSEEDRQVSIETSELVIETRAADTDKEESIVDATESAGSPVEDEQKETSAVKNIETSADVSTVESTATEEVSPVQAPVEKECSIGEETANNATEFTAAKEALPIPAPTEEKQNESEVAEKDCSAVENIETEMKTITEDFKVEVKTQENTIASNEPIATSKEETQTECTKVENIETELENKTEDSATEVKNIDDEVLPMPAEENLKTGSAVETKESEEQQKECPEEAKPVILETEEKEEPTNEANKEVIEVTNEQQNDVDDQTEAKTEVNPDNPAVEVKSCDEVPTDPTPTEESKNANSVIEENAPSKASVKAEQKETSDENIETITEDKTENPAVEVKACDEAPPDTTPADGNTNADSAVEADEPITAPVEEQNESSVENIEANIEGKTEISAVEVKSCDEVPPDSTPGDENKNADSTVEANEPNTASVEEEQKENSTVEHIEANIEDKTENPAVEIKSCDEVPPDPTLTEENKNADPALAANETITSTLEGEQTESSAKNVEANTENKTENSAIEIKSCDEVPPDPIPAEENKNADPNELITSTVEGQQKESSVENVEVNTEDKTENSAVELNSSDEVLPNPTPAAAIEANEPITPTGEGEQNENPVDVEAKTENSAFEIKLCDEVPPDPTPIEENKNTDSTVEANEPSVENPEVEVKTCDEAPPDTTPADGNTNADSAVEADEPITAPVEGEQKESSVENTEAIIEDKTVNSAVEVKSCDEVPPEPTPAEENTKADSAVEANEPNTAPVEEEQNENSAVENIEANTEGKSENTAVEIKSCDEVPPDPTLTEENKNADSTVDANEPNTAPVEEEQKENSAIENIEANTEDKSENTAVEIKSCDEVPTDPTPAEENTKADSAVQANEPNTTPVEEEQKENSKVENTKANIEDKTENPAIEIKSCDEVPPDPTPGEENTKADSAVESNELNTAPVEEEQKENSTVENIEANTEDKTENPAVEIKSCDEVPPDPTPAEENTKADSAVQANEPNTAPVEEEQKENSKVENTEANIEDKTENPAVEIKSCNEVPPDPTPGEENTKADSAVESNDLHTAPVEEEQKENSAVENIEANTEDKSENTAVEIKSYDEVPPDPTLTEENKNADSTVDANEPNTAPVEEEQKENSAVENIEANTEDKSENTAVEIKSCDEVPPDQKLTEENKNADSTVEANEPSVEGEQKESSVENIEAINEDKTENPALEVESSEKVPPHQTKADENTNSYSAVDADKPSTAPIEGEQTESSVGNIEAIIENKTENSTVEVKSCDEVPPDSTPAEENTKADSADEANEPNTAPVKEEQKENSTLENIEAIIEDKTENPAVEIKSCDEVPPDPTPAVENKKADSTVDLLEEGEQKEISVENIETILENKEKNPTVEVKSFDEAPPHTTPVDGKTNADSAVDADEQIAAIVEGDQKENSSVENIEVRTEDKTENPASCVEALQEPTPAEENENADSAMIANEPTTSTVKVEQKDSSAENVEASTEEKTENPVLSDSTPAEENENSDSAVKPNELITATVEGEQKESSVEKNIEANIEEKMEDPAGEVKSCDEAPPDTTPADGKANDDSAVKADEPIAAIVEGKQKESSTDNVEAITEDKTENPAVEVKSSDEDPPDPKPTEESKNTDSAVELNEPITASVEGEQNESSAEDIQINREDMAENPMVEIKSCDEIPPEPTPAKENENADSAIEANEPTTATVEGEQKENSAVENIEANTEDKTENSAVEVKSCDEVPTDSTPAEENKNADSTVGANEPYTAPVEEERKENSTDENIEANIEDKTENSAVEIKSCDEVPPDQTPADGNPDSVVEVDKPIAATVEGEDNESSVENVEVNTEDKADNPAGEIKEVEEVPPDPAPADDVKNADSEIEANDKIIAPVKEEQKENSPDDIEAKVEDKTENHALEVCEEVSTDSTPAEESQNADSANITKELNTTPVEEEQKVNSSGDDVETQIQDKMEPLAPEVQLSDEVSPILTPTEASQNSASAIEANEPNTASVEEEQKESSTADDIQTKTKDDTENSGIEEKQSDELPAVTAPAEENQSVSSAIDTNEPKIPAEDEQKESSNIESIETTVESKTEDSAEETKSIEKDSSIPAPDEPTVKDPNELTAVSAENSTDETTNTEQSVPAVNIAEQVATQNENTELTPEVELESTQGKATSPELEEKLSESTVAIAELECVETESSQVVEGTNDTQVQSAEKQIEPTEVIEKTEETVVIAENTTTTSAAFVEKENPISSEDPVLQSTPEEVQGHELDILSSEVVSEEVITRTDTEVPEKETGATELNNAQESNATSEVLPTTTAEEVPSETTKENSEHALIIVEEEEKNMSTEVPKTTDSAPVSQNLLVAECSAEPDLANKVRQTEETVEVPTSPVQEIPQDVCSKESNVASDSDSLSAKALQEVTAEAELENKIPQAQKCQESQAVSEDDPVPIVEVEPSAHELTTSDEASCIGFTTAEDKASGVKIETIIGFSSQVSDAITEILSEDQEVAPITLVPDSYKAVAHPTLQPTESLSDSAQYPPEVYDKISHPVLEVAPEKCAPCLAEELRMATANKNTTDAASNRVKPQSIACEGRCFASDSKPTKSIENESVSTDEPNAQGNQINRVDQQNSFTAQSESSTYALPTATSSTKTSTNSKHSGSQFRRLTLRDRRFLAELEKRRKQRELIQKYLDSLDSIDSPNYFNEDLYIVEIESKCSIIESSPYSLFIEPQDYCIVDATISSPTTKTHFLNKILFSDRISSESNCTDDSTPTVIDTFGSTTSLRESGSNSDSGEEFSPDDSTDRDSSATATTANISTNTTKTVTNQSHINSPPPELKTESTCSKLIYVETRTSGGNEEHVDDDPLNYLVPGSIAEREYKKWYNAVDMPNNPYSVEALRRRLSGGPDRVLDLPNISPSVEESPLILGEEVGPITADKGQERDYARYSRDYYINDAKNASGVTKKSPTSAATPSPTPTSSSIEIEEGVEVTSETIPSTPVRDMCHKLEKQCRIDADIYLATPVLVEEEVIPQIFAVRSGSQAVGSLTTEAVSRLSSGSSSLLTTSSLTPSEDSDTIRIYDLKKQETRLVKETTKSTLPESPVKKPRPTELEITPIATVSSKASTPTSFKFLQPKRKLLEPNQVLSIDLDTTPIPTPSSEKPVIEAEVVHAMPSVKALAKAFLLSSTTPSPTDNKWRKASRAKSPLQFFKITSPVAKASPKQPDPVIADTLSQGSEDATIASDLSSLETDPPSEPQSSQEKSLGSVLVPGCLRNNIAFFENLKNK